VKMVAHWEMALRSNFFKIAAKSRFCNDFFSLCGIFFGKKNFKILFFWDVSSENAWSSSSSGIKIGTVDFSELNFTGRNSSMALTRNK